MNSTNLGKTTYLGGLSEYRNPLTRDLWLTDTEIGLGDQIPQHATIAIGAIRSIDVETWVEAKSRLGATLAFGVIGALAAKGHKNRAIIVVQLKDATTVYYESQYLTAPEIIGQVASWMNAHGITSSADARHAELVSSRVDVTDKLSQLQSLHASGVLTDDEFTAAKARVLS